MQAKKFVALLAAGLVLMVASGALADSVQVDNDLTQSGNQNNVSAGHLAGETVTATAQVVVERSGQNHLTSPQNVTFSDAGQSTFTKDGDPVALPADLALDDIVVAITTWTTDGQKATGSGDVSFTAPADAGAYVLTVKWAPQNESCPIGNNGRPTNCLTGTSALVVNLTVTAPVNAAPVLTVADIGPVEGNTLGGATISGFGASASDDEDGDLTSAITCDHDDSEVFPVGTTTVTCSVTDAGELTDTESFDVVVVDTTAPDLTLPADITTGPTNAFGATVSWDDPSASDIVDGAVGVTCDTADGQFGFGTHTVSCSATDEAGNTASGSFTVTVNGFTLDGFFSPISMTLTNSIKGGSTVPVKWRLWGEDGQITDTAAVSSIKVAEYNCNTGDVLANSEVSTTSTSASGLRYDAAGEQFVYNWKTPSTKGKCYTLTAAFTDGSSLTAKFLTK